MAVAETIGSPPPVSFRDLPWRWSDLIIGFSPVTLATLAPYFIGPSLSRILPHWPWISLGFSLGWMFVFPVWVARRRSGLPRIPKFRSLLTEASFALLAIPVSMVAASAVVYLAANYLWGGASSNTFDDFAGSQDRDHAVAFAVLGVGFAPFGEEMLFRGVLFNVLRRRMHFLLAAMISGAVFGFYHPYSINERVYIATLGCFLALLYEWRKTLLSPILMHAFVNTLGMIGIFYALAHAPDTPILGVRGHANDKGCQITEVVPGSSAEAAGILVGDVITSAGENSVASLRDLVLVMRTKKIGDRIPVRFIRAGVGRQVEAVLKGRPK